MTEHKEELRNTPSFTDNIDSKTEDKFRNEGATFIADLGNKLGLRYDTCATAMVYFHRFYMFHSFKSMPRHLVAASCLFLAGKIEETPKKRHDIVSNAKLLLDKKYFVDFGKDPKEELMTMERILLKTIKFDFHVSHPYKFLVDYVKRIKGKQTNAEKLAQMSWTFINDSLRTNLCLKWEPEIVACAVLYLATKLSKQEIESWENQRSGEKWWEIFVEGMTVEILDLYHDPKNVKGSSYTSSSTPSKSVNSSNPNSESTSKSSSFVYTSENQRKHNPRHH